MTRRTKRRVAYGLTFGGLALVGFLFLHWWASLPPAAFRAVQVGMTRMEVEHLLGDPTWIQHQGTSRNLVHSEGDTVISGVNTWRGYAGSMSPPIKPGQYDISYDLALVMDGMQRAGVDDVLCVWADEEGTAVIRFDPHGVVVEKIYSRRTEPVLMQLRKFLGW